MSLPLSLFMIVHFLLVTTFHFHFSQLFTVDNFILSLFTTLATQTPTWMPPLSLSLSLFANLSQLSLSFFKIVHFHFQCGPDPNPGCLLSGRN